MNHQKSISFGTLVRSLDQSALDFLVAELAEGIDLFLAMGSKQVMGSNWLVNYLIQSTDGKFGYCDQKCEASRYLKFGMYKYCGQMRFIGGPSIVRFVHQVAGGRDAKEVILSAIAHKQNCKARRVIRDLSNHSTSL